MELFRALGALVEPPHEHTADLTAALELGDAPTSADYTDVFVLQLYPYASVYVGAEGMLGGDARDRIAGFWRALDLLPPADPDHIALMLALYAQLAEIEAAEGDPGRREVTRRARHAYLWEHLASWMFVYAAKLDAIAVGAYKRWGALLVAALAEEIATLGRQALLPLHLREAPPFGDVEADGAAELIASVLTPIRSGMIFVRADFARAGHMLGAGTRVGERAFMLRSLLSQDPAGTLRWLSEEARWWESFHATTEPLLGDVGVFWANRARTSAALLGRLAADAAQATG